MPLDVRRVMSILLQGANSSPSLEIKQTGYHSELIQLEVIQEKTTFFNFLSSSFVYTSKISKQLTRYKLDTKPLTWHARRTQVENFSSIFTSFSSAVPRFAV